MSPRQDETTGPRTQGSVPVTSAIKARDMKTQTLAGYCVGGLMLVTLLAGCADQESTGGDPRFADRQSASEQGTSQADMASGDPQQDGAQQALAGLLQIRQGQCQSGNQLACDA